MEEQTLAEIARTLRTTGLLIDPHTAVATAAARRRLATDSATPVVALATAHPAKFPDAVEKATGRRPALPDHLADLMDRRERVTVLANDAAAVERHIRAHGRAAASVGAA